MCSREREKKESIIYYEMVSSIWWILLKMKVMCMHIIKGQKTKKVRVKSVEGKRKGVIFL